MNDLPQQLSDIIWDIPAAISPNAVESKPLLAHYTDAQTAMAILQNEEIWFSSPHHMNDKQEFLYGIRHSMKTLTHDYGEFAARPETTDEKWALISGIWVALSAYLNHFEAETSNDETYIWCLSEHKPHDDDGILSMWRNYGADASGVALVFRTDGIRRDSDSPLRLSKVQYISAEERNAFVQSRLEKIHEYLMAKNISSKSDLFRAIPYELVEMLKVYSLFSKHRGFIEENEWRVVYRPTVDRRDEFTSMLDYTVGSNGIVPRLKLRMDRPSSVFVNGYRMIDAIDRIILGPGMSSPLARRSVERMLKRIGNMTLADRIRVSTIPYRSL